MLGAFYKGLYLPSRCYPSTKKTSIMASCLDPSEIPSFIEKIPYLLECHQKEYPGKKALEKKYEHKPPRKPEDAVEFVEKVCTWSKGRGYHLKNDIPNNNDHKYIKSILSEGYTRARRGNVAEGVEYISNLKYVGQSYASKMLHFLLPDHTVILDEIIRRRCVFSETANGYKKFLKYCHDLLDQAEKSPKLPAGFKNNLRVCDIEAALFMYIQNPVP